jgi:acyl-CoA hydrolase
MRVPDSLIERLLENLINRVEAQGEQIAALSTALALNTSATANVAEKVDKQNGNVARLTAWQAEINDERKEAADIAKGRRDQRSDDLAKVDAARSFLADYVPIVVAAVLGAGGAWLLIWGWF